jgi:hypothetical protein
MSSYQSFNNKDKSICEKIVEYCTPSKSDSPVSRQSKSPPPPTPPPLKRHRRIYKRKERSTPHGEIYITVVKKKEVETSLKDGCT